MEVSNGYANRIIRCSAAKICSCNSLQQAGDRGNLSGRSRRIHSPEEIRPRGAGKIRCQRNPIARAARTRCRDPGRSPRRPARRYIPKKRFVESHRHSPGSTPQARRRSVLREGPGQHKTGSYSFPHRGVKPKRRFCRRPAAILTLPAAADEDGKEVWRLIGVFQIVEKRKSYSLPKKKKRRDGLTPPY